MTPVTNHCMPDTAASNGRTDGVSLALTPGEKLFEELFYDEHMSLPTKHPKIMRVPGNRIDAEHFGAEFERLRLALADQDEHTARAILFEMIRASEHADPLDPLTPALENVGSEAPIQRDASVMGE
jgi:FlaA1/EpsC-like NDP-sugar epimerase